ncbi:MAG: DUF3298 and DUF4163 domain-containing protein [Flavobacteriaceae bacterium]|nr:DUF3298 and DUF4163 domain-containing protein [Flavobacteriaceae bacterium]
MEVFKKTVCIFILGGLLFSCKEEKAVPEQFHLESNGCSSCPTASVNYQYIRSNEKSLQKIHADIDKRIIRFLVREGTNAPTVAQAMATYTKAADYKQKFPEEDISNWNITIDGEIRYQDADLLSFEFEFYSYSGGAHGYGETVLLTYNTHTGDLLDLNEILLNNAHFMQLAEEKFRKQEDIPLDGNINDTGFMFPDEVFVLADNIGLNDKGLIMIYNQYEISAYAEGKKELEIPWDTIKAFLKI